MAGKDRRSKSAPLRRPDGFDRKAGTWREAKKKADTQGLGARCTENDEAY